MAKDPRLSTAAVNAGVDAVCALLDDGMLRIYEGTKPASADAGISQSQILLAELRFGIPAFAMAVDGEATANPITKESLAKATGTPMWFRALTADGVTVSDGTVGVTDSDMDMNIVVIQIGAEISVPTFTLRLPRA